MKKTILLLAALFACMAVYSKGEEKPARVRSSYFNLGFAESKLDQDDFGQMTSDWGAFFAVGKTFYLHKEPILNLIKFGIDATWFDLTYAHYKPEVLWRKGTFHHAEAAVHVGPSVTVTPLDGLSVNAYFRYAPTFSAIYSTTEDHYNLSYATRFVCGATVSYKVIGVGVETRFGMNNIDPLAAFYTGADGVDKVKTKLRGFRVFVTFRY